MLIDKITIAVENMDAMMNFYSAFLEMTLTPIEMYGQTLYGGQAGNLEVLLCPRELAGVEAKTNTVQLRFVIEDIAAAYSRGLSAGGTSLNEPQAIDGRLHGALRDPDNNSVEFAAPLS